MPLLIPFEAGMRIGEGFTPHEEFSSTDKQTKTGESAKENTPSFVDGLDQFLLSLTEQQ